MSRNDNKWADWLARVARHVKRDVGLEEFVEVWPTDQPAPKEVGACGRRMHWWRVLSWKAN